jgi:hypothetical protein
MADDRIDRSIRVLSKDGEEVELMSTEDDLRATYATLRDGVPDGWILPFSADTISMWDVVQHTRAMHLYPHVKEVFDHLGVTILSLTAQDHQVDWLEKMLRMAAERGMIQDTTPLGGGKTYMHCLLAQLLSLPVLAIVPANVVPVWEVMKVTVPSLTVMSYDKFRGSRKGTDGVRELKHGLLRRIDSTQKFTKNDGTEGELHHCEFVATDMLKRMCRDGLMVVIDEMQSIKNRSGQQRACRTLISAVRESQSSIVTMLSGSPFDKEEHVTNLMMSIGYVRDPYLIRSVFGRVQYLGLAEMITACKTLDKRMTEATISTTPQAKTKKEADTIVMKLFKHVIKPCLVGGAPRPNIPFTQHVSNTSFVFSPEDALAYGIAMTDMRTALTTDKNTGQVLSVEFSTMQSALMRMEARCCPSIITDALARLRRVPLSQVLVFCTYKDTYDILQEGFETQGYEVGVMNGDTPMGHRPGIVDRFQRGLLRILLVGVKVGGVGLSLHDRLGGRPRYCYGLPTWEAIAMYQCTGRSYRPGTLSDTWYEFVYCQQWPCMKLIDSIHRKSETIRDGLANPDLDSIVLPGEFSQVTRRPGDETHL